MDTVEIRDRIFDAANLLYEEAGRLVFPTVDAVRKRARVNMNDASTAMKEWRRKQTMHVVAPVTVQVPPSLQQVSGAALAEIWSAAVTLANESLRAAQSSWDADRAESETLAQQMATAFEEQAAELEAANRSGVELQQSLSAAVSEAAALKNQVIDTLRELDIARAAEKQSDGKTTEIERRASDLRLELNHAHQLAAAATEDRAAWQLRVDREIAGLRAALSKVTADAELECARAQAALTSAIAAAARLSGQIEALTMAAPAGTDHKPSRKPRPNGQAKQKE